MKKNSFGKKVLAVALVFVLIAGGVWVDNAFANKDKDSNHILGESGATLGESGAVLGESADKGKTPVPLGMSMSITPFAMGDVTVQLSTTTEQFDSYTNIDTGAAVPQMNATVGVTIAKDGLTGVSVVVDSGILDGYLGVGNPYFSYSAHGALKADSIFESVTDNLDGTITIQVKDGQVQNDSESITLLFDMDAAYDGNVSPQAPMASITAKAFVGSEEVGHSANTLEIKSSTSHRNSMGRDSREIALDAFVPSVPAADGKFDIWNGQVVFVRSRSNNYDMFRNLLDPDFQHVHRYYLPVGTTISPAVSYTTHKGAGDLGIVVADGEVTGVPGGTYYIFEFIWPNVKGSPSSGWNLFPGEKGIGYIQQDIAFVFPPQPAGTEIVMHNVLTYKLTSDAAPTYKLYPLTYRIDDSRKWNYRHMGSHGTGEGTVIPMTGIGDGQTGKYALKTGYPYNNGGTSGNYGNVPIENMKFRLYQANNNAKSPKVNFHNLTVQFARERDVTPAVKVDIFADITNAITGNTRTSGRVRVEPPSAADDQVIVPNFDTLVDLGANEYVKSIYMVPMGTDGNSEGTLPVGNSLSFLYNFKAWQGQKWPDGTPVDNYTLVPMGWDVEFDNEGGVPDKKAGVVASVRYFIQGPHATVQSAPISANKAGAEPDSIVTYRLTGYNTSRSGAQSSWKEPIIIVGMPAGIQLDLTKGIVAKYINGTTIGTVTPTPLAQTGNRSYYKLTFPYGTSIAISDVAQFTLDFDIKVPTGIPSGDYKLDIVLTANPPTSFYMGNDSYQNNALPAGQTKADYGLGAADNYTWSDIGVFTQQPFKVIPKSKSNASSRIQTDKIAPEWTTNRVAPADFGNNVKMELQVKNNGNITMNKIRLYDIIPYSGYTTTEGYVSSGSVAFTGITGAPAGSTVYYFHGAGDPPSLSEIKSITAPSADGTTWTIEPAGAKAFYVDFGANSIAGGSSLAVTMNFKVPELPAPQQTVYNQFSFMYTTVEGTSSPTGVSQGFSTHYYNVEYTASAADLGKVENLPAAQSGGFEGASAVDIVLSSERPTKKFYDFQHWKDAGSTKTYAPGDTVPFTLTPKFKELTLEAVFTPNPLYAITVNFLKGGNATTTGTIVPSTLAAHGGDIIGIPNISSLATPGQRTTGRFLTSTGGVFDFTSPLGGSPTTLDLTVEWETDSTTNFVLSFDVNGGNAASKPADMNAILGLPVGALPGGDDGTGPGGPFRTGHTLKGWAKTKANADAGIVNFTSAEMISAPTTVYAVWKAHEYTVTLNLNGGSGGPTSLVVEHGNATNIQTLPKEGDATPSRLSYKFKGWARTKADADLGLVDFTQGQLATLTGDITLYASWYKNLHELTLDQNGATTAGTVLTMDISEGNTTSEALPVTPTMGPARVGHSFLGWSKDKTVPHLDNATTVTFFTNTDLASITAPLTIYAVWKPNIYTLSFDNDGGTAGSITSKPVVFGEKVGDLPTGTQAPSKAGWVFAGWAVTQGQTTADFTATYVYQLESGKTVYPVWEAKGIEVTLNPNGGVVGLKTSLNIYFKNLAATSLPLFPSTDAPTYYGHDLIGWAKTKSDADLGTVDFVDADLATITDDTEIFAVWKLKTYTLRLDSNGGTDGTVTTLNIKHGNPAGVDQKALPTIAGQIPTRAGYNHLGWSLTSGVTQVLFTDADLAGIDVDTNVLYAVWELKTYTLTLNGNGETTAGSPLSLVVKHGNPSGISHVVLPTITSGAPIRTGYTFGGWAKTTADAASGIDSFTNTDLALITDDTEIFAVWKLKTYTLRLDSNGGTDGTVTTLSIKHGNPAGADHKVLPTSSPNAPTRNGYTFGGWARSATATTADFTDANLVDVKMTMTVYAYWIPNGYTLFFDIDNSDLGATQPAVTSKLVTFDRPIGELPMGEKAPKRTGYQFQGWSTKTAAASPGGVNSVNVSSGNKYKTPDDSTVYAVWDIDVYTVLFDGDGGGSAEGFPMSRTVSYKGTLGTQMPQVVPVKTGYDFLGWSTTRGSLTADFTGTTSVVNSMSVYAVWKVQTYTVTFDSGDVATPAVPAAVNADYSTTLVGKMPTNPEKTGHTFKGWSTKKNSTVSDFNDTTLIVKPITVHPVWEINKYLITTEQWFYGYGQDHTSAVKGTKVIGELVEYGTGYHAKLEDIADYNFMAKPSDQDIAMVVGPATIKLYYQEISYTVNADAEVELDVNDRYPVKNRAVTLREFVKIAELRYTTNKTVTTRSLGKPLPSTAIVTSPNFADLDYSTITSDYNQSVDLDITWSTGQVNTITVNVQMLDRTAPTIEISQDQRFNLRERRPGNETELIEILFARGMVISDNYDKEVYPKISYLDGGFSNIPWKRVNSEGSIIFLTATDSSGNLSPERKAVIITWKPETGEEGTNVPDKGGKVPGGDSSEEKDKHDGGEKTGESEDASGVSVKGIGYDEETNSLTVGGKPVLKLPKTGGRELATVLATAAYIVPIALVFLFVMLFLAARRKKDEEEKDSQQEE